jgi:predicted dehydrogenase
MTEQDVAKLIGSKPILVVGSGSIARRHMANLRALHPACRIVVLRRPDSHSPALPDDVESVADLEAALALQPFAAIVANPSPFRVALAQRLAAAGCHLLLEKPLSDGVDGIPTMLQTAAAKTLTLMVGYNLRFLPALQALAQAVAAGQAGRLLRIEAAIGMYLPDWRPGTDYRQGVSAQAHLGGGPLLELSHEIDLALWLGGPVRRVSARLQRLGALEIDVEDSAELLLDFASGAQGHVQLDFLQRQPRRMVRLIGSEATLEWDYFAGHVRLGRGGGDWEVLFAPIQEDRNAMYQRELVHFFACIAGEAKAMVDGHAALQIQQVIQAARQSAAQDSRFITVAA